MKNLLKQPLTIISIIVLFLAVILWWLFAMDPAQNKISSIQQQQTTDLTQLDGLQARLNSLKREQNVVLSPTVTKFLNKTFPIELPPYPLRPFIVLEIAVLASLNNLSLTSIGDFPTGTWNGLVDIPITFTINGPYSNEYHFLKELYSTGFPRLITIQSLSITVQPLSISNSHSSGTPTVIDGNILNLNSTQTATMTISAYAYTTDRNTKLVPPSSFTKQFKSYFAKVLHIYLKHAKITVPNRA